MNPFAWLREHVGRHVTLDRARKGERLTRLEREAETTKRAAAVVIRERDRLASYRRARMSR